MRRSVVLLLGLVIAAGPAAAAPAETRLPAQVVRYGGMEALAARLAWALGEASKSSPGRAFSVGWSFRRLMAANEMIGSYHDGPGGREITVEEVLAGKRSLGQGSGGGGGRGPGDGPKSPRRPRAAAARPRRRSRRTWGYS